ncbi:hypothetical protein ACTSKR_09145 [Chitinibacteraceae bacterium HSL-7]
MTLSCQTAHLPALSGIELIPAHEAQSYIRSLASQLAKLDGEPVYLVHDGETGTSDMLIWELENALLDDADVSPRPAAQLLQACFSHQIGFRTWRANNDPDAHVNNTCAVGSLADAYDAIRQGYGAMWQTER